MKKFIILVIILHTVILSGCGDTPTSSPEIDVSKLMPLKIGNQWKYYSGYYNAVGNLDSAVELQITIDGSTTIRMNDTSSWYSSNNIFYTNKSDGLWIQGNSSLPFLAFKFPADGGDQYQVETKQIRVIAQFKPISVPAGDFSCYGYVEYDTTATTDSIFSYFAPGYGLVQRSFYRNDQSTYYLYEQWSLTYARFN